MATKSSLQEYISFPQYISGPVALTVHRPVICVEGRRFDASQLQRNVFSVQSTKHRVISLLSRPRGGREDQLGNYPWSPKPRIVATADRFRQSRVDGLEQRLKNVEEKLKFATRNQRHIEVEGESSPESMEIVRQGSPVATGRYQKYESWDEDSTEGPEVTVTLHNFQNRVQPIYVLSTCYLHPSLFHHANMFQVIGLQIRKDSMNKATGTCQQAGAFSRVAFSSLYHQKPKLSNSSTLTFKPSTKYSQSLTKTPS